MLLLSLTMFSCYENRGNYDYTVAATVDVDALLSDVFFPNGYVAEEYVVDPAFSDSILNLFYFRWEEISDTTVIIADSEVLRFTPQNASSVSLKLVAIDKVYGTFTNSSTVTIDIDAEGYINQWMVLAKVDGVEGLSLITPTYRTDTVQVMGESGVYEDSTYTVRVYEPYYNVNTSLPSGYQKLEVGYGNNYLDSSIGTYTPDNTYLLTTTDGESYWLDNEYPYNVYSTLKSNINDIADDFEYHTYFHVGTSVYTGGGIVVAKDGSVYKKVLPSYDMDCHYCYQYFPVQFYALDGVTPIKMLNICDKFFESSDYYYYFSLAEYAYDDPAQDNYGQRFMAYFNSNCGTVTADCFGLQSSMINANVYADEEVEEYVDFTNLGDWEIVWSDWFNYLYQMVIFKRGDEVKFTFVTNKYTYMSINQRDFPNPEIFDDPNLQIVSQETYYLFMGSGNKLYRYIYTSNSFEEYYTSIPADETITAMCFNNTERELLVGTDKGSIYVIDCTRYLELTEESKLLNTIEGFSEIIDIDYKAKNYTYGTYAKTGYTYSSAYAD